MRISKISIENFKSLKCINFFPSDLSVLVGPNASGKSNFSDALDFISDVYRHGLEIAIARKGGYENIAFRAIRRTRSEIKFSISCEVQLDEFLKTTRGTLFSRRTKLPKSARKSKSVIEWTHSFSFKVTSRNIGSSFVVRDESLEVGLKARDKSSTDTNLIKLGRKEERLSTPKYNIDWITNTPLESFFEFYQKHFEVINDILSPQQLLIEQPLFRHPIFTYFIGQLGHVAVHRLSPDTSRQPGVPTPNPEMSERGENLPAVVEWIKKNEPSRWDLVLTAMQEIVPGLESIDVQYLHTKTLGLFFKEKGVGKSWPAQDVSDGTIQALGLLAASADPRASGLVIEEPENSVHPWVIQSVLKKLQSLSKDKPVIITTHSPVLLDSINPKDLWLVYKRNGKTEIEKADEVDPDIVRGWEAGHFKLSEYIGSGLVMQAVPGGME